MSNPNEKTNQEQSLEAFVDEKQKAFERVEMFDADQLWTRIAPEVEVASPNAGSGWGIQLGTYWKWSIAATILLLLVAGLLLQKGDPGIEEAAYTSIFPEIQEQVDRYQVEITQKEAAIGIDELPQGAYQQIFDEMALLEEIRVELLKDLPAYADQEKLRYLFLKYYEQKIKMLDRLAREVEKKESKKQKNEEDIIM